MSGKSNVISSAWYRVIPLLLFVSGLLLIGGCEELPDDPDQGQDQDSGSQVNQDSTPPNIVVTTYFDDFAGLKFGAVPVGLQARGEFHIYNKGTSRLIIEDVVFQGTIFKYLSPGGFVEGKGLSAVSVKFIPEEEKSYTDTLTIRSNDPAHPVVTLPVSGRGVPDNGKG